MQHIACSPIAIVGVWVLVCSCLRVCVRVRAYVRMCVFIYASLVEQTNTFWDKSAVFLTIKCHPTSYSAYYSLKSQIRIQTTWEDQTGSSRKRWLTDWTNIPIANTFEVAFSLSIGMFKFDLQRSRHISTTNVNCNRWSKHTIAHQIECPTSTFHWSIYIWPWPF